VIAVSFEKAMVEELAVIIDIGSKVYPLVVPQIDGAPVPAPYVVYGSSEGVRVRALDGYKDGKGVEVDINIVASTYPDMKRIAAAVIDMIVSFEQRAIGSEGLFIQEVILEDPGEIYDDVPKLHKCVFSFTVHI
jgi:hypothetical protein